MGGTPLGVQRTPAGPVPPPHSANPAKSLRSEPFPPSRPAGHAGEPRCNRYACRSVVVRRGGDGAQLARRRGSSSGNLIESRFPPLLIPAVNPTLARMATRAGERRRVVFARRPPLTWLEDAENGFAHLDANRSAELGMPPSARGRMTNVFLPFDKRVFCFSDLADTEHRPIHPKHQAQLKRPGTSRRAGRATLVASAGRWGSLRIERGLSERSRAPNHPVHTMRFDGDRDCNLMHPNSGPVLKLVR